jgi:hypothetical protein
MALQPQGTSGNGRINARLFPPVRFIATAVDLAMMTATQGDREFITHFAAKRPRLRKLQMMSVCRAAAADQTRLIGNQSNVIPVANPPAAPATTARFCLLRRHAVDFCPDPYPGAA